MREGRGSVYPARFTRVLEKKKEIRKEGSDMSEYNDKKISAEEMETMRRGAKAYVMMHEGIKESARNMRRRKDGAYEYGKVCAWEAMRRRRGVNKGVKKKAGCGFERWGLVRWFVGLWDRFCSWVVRKILKSAWREVEEATASLRTDEFIAALKKLNKGNEES